jgi:nicotinic acid mononucleotide adenylyltransferase
MNSNRKNTDVETLRQVVNRLDPLGEPEAILVHRCQAGITSKGECLLVLDASYNPMTLAHEGIINAAKSICGPKEVLLMLSRANVDKEIFGADLGQRLSMLLTYAHQHPDYSVAGCSHARFVDKALALIPHYPPGARLFFVIGYDTLERLFDHRYYKNMESDLDMLFGHATIIVANRDHNDKISIQARMEAPDVKPYTDGINLIELPEELCRISSTHARTNIKQGIPIEGLVPGVISEAIQRMGLYED